MGKTNAMKEKKRNTANHLLTLTLIEINHKPYMAPYTLPSLTTASPVRAPSLDNALMP